MLTQSSFGKGLGVNNGKQGHNGPDPAMGPSGQGYISDYYLNNNANGAGAVGQKLIKRHIDGNSGAVVSGDSEGGDHMNDNPNSNNNGGGGPNKLSNKKFFKSKIDFMAPVKSLRGGP